MKKSFKIFLCLLFFLIFPYRFIQSQTPYKSAVISSAHELASQVGIDIIKQGGNVVDAAVAVGFALAVVYPQAGNIGGGGFMVIQFADGNSISIDYREKAPSSAKKDMFLDINGNVIEDLSTYTALASGVPGSVAGLLYALEKYGSLSRDIVIAPAIELAEKGFRINSHFASALKSFRGDFSRFESSKKIFGRKYRDGDLFVQKDLAETLREISKNGKDGFYKGKIAGLIVDEMQRGNGIITLNDLAVYNPVERPVLKGTYRGYDITTMGPPSSGGICLIYLLNILENFNLRELGYYSASYVHILSEAMRRVYADRAEFMGDADFVAVPTDILTSKVYAKRRIKDYNENKASTSKEVGHGDAYYRESDQTTHYSIADFKGNCVSVTTTLNDLFGSRLVVDGAGFLLNNEMDDFSIKQGVPNIYGLVGSEANSIAPNKRMLSSMTPTIITKNGRPFMVIGSPGGGRIITSVLQTILNVIDFEMPLEDAVSSWRIHHQWLPDKIQYENGAIDKEVIKQLKAMGHTVSEVGDFGRIEAIIFNPNGTLTGMSDLRGYGKAVGF